MADTVAPTGTMAGGAAAPPAAARPSGAAAAGTGSSGSRRRNEPIPVPPRLSKVPRYWYVYVLVVGWFYLIHQLGIMPYVLAYYALYPLVAPVGDWSFGIRIFFRLLRGPFDGYYWSHNLVCMGVLLSRVLFLFPIETLLWYLDRVLFPGYRKQPVEQPLLLLGQPRSGTTKLEEILSEDDEHLVSLRLIEMRFPYLTVQYLLDGLVWLDRHVLFGLLRRIFFDTLHLNHPYDHKGPRHEMRRLQYELHDEDDIIFLFHQMHHFQLCGILPDPDFVRHLLRFSALPQYKRRRVMQFHRECVQKVLYRRGQGKTYFAKWVACWNGMLNEARVVYPDAQYIVIVRDPALSLPSWFKLQSLLSIDMSGEDIMARPHLRQVFKEENIAWFKAEIEFCRTTPPRTLYLLSSEEFYNDIPGSMRKVGPLGERGLGRWFDGR